jgi:hypothetical protein
MVSAQSDHIFFPPKRCHTRPKKINPGESPGLMLYFSTLFTTVSG